MMFEAYLIHYFMTAFCTMTSGISVALGQAFTSKAAFDGINRQPTAKDDISRASLLSLALIETAAIIGLLGSILLIFQSTPNIYSAIGQIGFAVALSIPGLVLGFAASKPSQAAILAIARQPLFSKKIMNLMLLTQSLIQTPLAFGFIIALIIKSNLDTVNSLPQALILLASGISIGFGCVGPALGVGNFTQASCQSAGINKSAYARILSFTIISQAIIETPVIFATIISFLILRTVNIIQPDNLPLAIIYLVVSILMAIGTFAPGLSSGKTAASACKQIAYDPNIYSSISRTSMIAQGLIDTLAIYAFIVALFLILKPI